jgi:hypothetical protein
MKNKIRNGTRFRGSISNKRYRMKRIFNNRCRLSLLVVIIMATFFSYIPTEYARPSSTEKFYTGLASDAGYYMQS